MKIFKRGRHRAPRGCHDHVIQIARHNREIEICEQIMCKLSDDRDSLQRENQRLRRQVAALKFAPVTEPLPPVLPAADMIHPTAMMVPLGPSVMVPATDRRNRDHRPNWALDSE